MRDIASKKNGQKQHPAFSTSNQVTPEGLALKLRITPAQALKFLKGNRHLSSSWTSLCQGLGIEGKVPVVYTVNEVASMLGVSASAVRRWLAADRLIALPLLKPIRISGQALSIFLSTSALGHTPVTTVAQSQFTGKQLEPGWPKAHLSRSFNNRSDAPYAGAQLHQTKCNRFHITEETTMKTIPQICNERVTARALFGGFMAIFLALNRVRRSFAFSCCSSGSSEMLAFADFGQSCTLMSSALGAAMQMGLGFAGVSRLMPKGGGGSAPAPSSTPTSSNGSASNPPSSPSNPALPYSPRGPIVPSSGSMAPLSPLPSGSMGSSRRLAVRSAVGQVADKITPQQAQNFANQSGTPFTQAFSNGSVVTHQPAVSRVSGCFHFYCSLNP